MERSINMHHRRSIRLPGYDYSQLGAYFLTICAYQREYLFGEIKNGIMGLNEIGDIISHVWDVLPKRFPQIILDEFVVMPNHIHGIVWITEDRHHPTVVGVIHELPLRRMERRRMTLPLIVGYLKMNATKRIHTLNPLFGPVWQRNYYERIIRNERELQAIRMYIRNNPLKWETDVERLP